MPPGLALSRVSVSLANQSWANAIGSSVPRSLLAFKPWLFRPVRGRYLAPKRDWCSKGSAI